MPPKELMDIHSHILPGLDDGSADLNESLEIAQTAFREGIRTIVCTPHAARGYDELIRAAGGRLKSLREKLLEKQIPICLELGFEVLVCERLLYYENLKGLSFCIGGKPHMLLEFDFDRFPSCLDEVLYLLRLENIQPIFAHPERYYYLYDNITFLKNMKSRGVKLQVNAGSITGSNGSAVKAFVKKIIKNGLVDFIATDTHSNGKRGPYMKQAVRLFTDWIGKEGRINIESKFLSQE